MRRRVTTTLLLVALALALVDGVTASSEQLPGVARGTALCPQPIGLRLEFGAWSKPRPNSPHEFFAAVWTRGGRGAGGLDIYAAATAGESRINRLCKRIVQRGVSSPRALRAPLRYQITESGNAYFVDAGGAVTPGTAHWCCVDPIAERHAVSKIYECDAAQRIVVHTHILAGQRGHYLSVRAEQSRRLLALAILRSSGDSSFRVSRTCQPD
jgi:hypothetical protein